MEVGLILTNASTLSSLLELLLQTSSAPATSIESQTTYRRAFRAAAARKWQLTPTPATTTRDERPHPEESKFFRLISPGLDNEQHYNRCAAFLKQVEAGASTSSAVQLNPTTGLRVHVDVTGLSCEGLKRVCQNYVKYEAAIDSFLPPSRRTGSPASQRYFQSIRQATALHRIATTNKERNDAIGSCENMESLLLLLNPQG